MSDVAPTPTAAPDASSGDVSSAQAAAGELTTLTSSPEFSADFAGSNGRAAQIQARDRKSTLTQQAHSREVEAPAPVLPEKIQEGLESTSQLERATAQAMTPGQSPQDYKFQWEGASDMEIDHIAAMNETAATAAFSVGASPEYARATVNHLQSMISNSSGVEPTDASLQEALTKQFGANSDATVEAAKATLAKMEPEAREWAMDAIGHLDASGVSWIVGRLASVNRANSK